MVVANAIKMLLAALAWDSVVPPLQQFAAATTEDWQGLLRLARKHGVAALLYQRLKTMGITVPPEILAVLRTHYLHSAGRNMKLYHDLSPVLERLHLAHIPVILLKGAFLAQHIYNSIALRTMGDVDLLIKVQDLQAVQDILLDLGFMRNGFHIEAIGECYHVVFTHPDHGLCIEMHWNLMESESNIQVDIDSLWLRSQPTLIADIPVQQLSAEDLVLHLCLHNCHHAFAFGLRSIYDLVATLRHYREEIDWHVLSTLAQAWGIQRPVEVNLLLAYELLQAPLPKDWLDMINNANFDPYFLVLAQEELFLNKEEIVSATLLPPRLAQAYSAQDMPDKILQVWQALFPPRQLLAMEYPVSPHSWRIMLYYLVRWKDLLTRHGKLVLSFLTGETKTVQQAQSQKRSILLRNWLLSSDTK